MTEHSTGDQAQVRIIAEQLVDAAIVRYREVKGTDAGTMKLTPSVKWSATIMATMIAAFGIWSVKTLNEVQLAVVEIKTQLGASGAIEIRLQNTERRLAEIERRQLTEDHR